MSSDPIERQSYPIRKLPKTSVWADSTPLDRNGGKPAPFYSRRRIRWGLLITLAGFLFFLLGARPGLFGVDRSPVIGFVQIVVFLIGLGMICLGGYISMMALWKNEQVSIAADIGLRLVVTGFVIAVFAGLADIFGVGSHPLSTLPFFGPLQARGVMIAQGIIAAGFFLLIPYHRLVREQPPRPEKPVTRPAKRDKKKKGS